MIVKTDKSFEKDIHNITDNILRSKIADCIEKIQNAESINNISGAKKLIGYIHYYRIRIGDYRVGFRIENGIIILERCLHRKDIYRFFPKG